MSDEDELFGGPSRPSDELDEIFGVGSGVPTPRTGTIVTLLAGGLVVGTVGLACTSVPGGVMVLLAWMLVEKEMDRIESGYLPEEARRVVGQLQVLAYVGVAVVVLLFGVQAYLFCSGGYDMLWGALLDAYAEWMGVS